MIGEEEKEEVKDAVEDEPKVEDTPQEDEESFDQEESEDEDESGMKSFILSFDISLFFEKYVNYHSCILFISFKLHFLILEIKAVHLAVNWKKF